MLHFYELSFYTHCVTIRYKLIDSINFLQSVVNNVAIGCFQLVG